MILKAMTNLSYPKKAFQTLGGHRVGKEFIKGADLMRNKCFL